MVADPPAPHPPVWDSIIATHDRRVILLLLAMGLRIDEAKELAQATWLRLMEQHDRGALARLEFPGLALRQARFLALDELRRRGKTALVAEPTDGIAPLPSAETTLIRREELTCVLTTLARCSTAEQRVFRTVYEEPGISHAEAAARLGVSVQRVRQVICEVRKKLRSALEVSDD